MGMGMRDEGWGMRDEERPRRQESPGPFANASRLTPAVYRIVVSDSRRVRGAPGRMLLLLCAVG
jgi:hypothetical protein